MDPDYRTYRVVLARVVLACVALFMVTSQPALAADQIVSDNYEAVQPVDGAGNTFYCANWSGDADALGNFYYGCKTSILVVNDEGQLTRKINLPIGLDSVRDTAVSPDGKYIYWITGALRLDYVAAQYRDNVGHVRRYVRDGNGTYNLDPDFDIDPIYFTNGTYWSPRGLTVDNNGRLYMTVNAYIIEYDRNGNRVAFFGGDDEWVDGVYKGGLEVGQGLTVDKDGSTLWVVEQRHNHVQQWKRTQTGWQRNRNFQIGKLNDDGCDANNVFSSPYDVGLDRFGYLYVLDVTCGRIQKYRENGTFIDTVWSMYNLNQRMHGIAVNFEGDVIIPEHGWMFVNQVEPEVCEGIGDTPTITGVKIGRTQRDMVYKTLPGLGQWCHPITQVKITGDHAGTTAWTNFGVKVITLARRGDNDVRFQVRDAEGNISPIFTRQITAGADVTGGGAAPDNRVRIKRPANLWGRKRYCYRDPMALLANRRQYKLIDPCATMVGYVRNVSTRNGYAVATITITPRTTRKVFHNPPRSYRLYAIGSLKARGMRNMAEGQKILFTGALIGKRSTRQVMAVPVTHVQILRR